MNFNNDDDIIISHIVFPLWKCLEIHPNLVWDEKIQHLLLIFFHICTIDTFFQQILTFEDNSVFFMGLRAYCQMIHWQKHKYFENWYFDKWWGNKNQLCLGKTIDFRTLVP